MTIQERLRLIAKSTPDKLVTIRFRAIGMACDPLEYDHKVISRADDVEDMIYATENTWSVYCRDVIVDGQYV